MAVAPVTNPLVVTYVNGRSRVAADAILSAYRTLKEAVAEYAAKGIGPLVAGTVDLQNSTIDDSYLTTGGTPLIGYDVDVFNGAAISIIAAIEANGNAILNQITKPSVNSLPRF